MAKQWIYFIRCFKILALLTHWGQDKMAAISQTTFSNALSWMKMLEFRLRFHWSLFAGAQLTIFQHWFRQWLGADQGTSHYLNQWWPTLVTHICVSRPQWVKETMDPAGPETCVFWARYSLISIGNLIVEGDKTIFQPSYLPPQWEFLYWWNDIFILD